MHNFLTAIWACAPIIGVGILIWVAACLAIAPPVGRSLANHAGDRVTYDRHGNTRPLDGPA